MTGGSPDDAVVEIYERHAADYDRDRARGLQERSWLDRWLALVRPSGAILDIGCGMGEPIARYILERGFQVVGVDASPAMIRTCRGRLPDAEWMVADMRTLDLGRRFDGVLAWDSLFHLNEAAQRGMFPRFAAHAGPGAALMFTSGPRAGVAMGEYCGEPLFHASLATEEYRRLLGANGFAVQAFVPDDPTCGRHTIWLATAVTSVP